MCLMKTQASFHIRTYFKGRVNLSISGTETYNDLCQIHVHRNTAVSKTLVFRLHKKLKYGFTNPKYGSHPGQPKTVVTDANMVAVAGLI